MTLSEANLVAKLIGYADAGCTNCVRELATHANRLFPDYTFVADDDTSFEDYPAYWDPSYILTRPFVLVTVAPRPQP